MDQVEYGRAFPGDYNEFMRRVLCEFYATPKSAVAEGIAREQVERKLKGALNHL
jgi:hypothetical protein